MVEPPHIEAMPIDYINSFKNFIETFKSREGILKYYERVWQLIRMGQRSLVVDFDDLILFDPSLAGMVIERPSIVLESFNQALLDIILRESPEFAKSIKKFYVRIRNPPQVMKIRELSSEHIGKLVAIDGIVTRVTRVDAKILRAKYRHITESGEHEFDYPPEGQIGERVEKPPYCPVCHKPGKFELLIEKSDFIDWQKIVVQEKPEEVPGGQIPRSVEAVLTGDIVDSVRPGDRVVISGILRVTPLASFPDRRVARTIFSFYIDVNHVEVQEKMLEEITITREDEEKIKELARDPWIREKIISSIAPGIYGYWDIKEAIALLLFGGSPKILPDGTRIRGDIHVLITGDPGTAKSQLLQFTSRLAPRGLYTSGKGSTAAGLTATVLRDKITGEYYLEAGALVLADGGVACLHPDTRVVIDNEYVKIGEIFKSERSFKALSKGEPVELNHVKHETVGLDLANLSSKKATVIYIRRKPWRGKLIKLLFKSGHELLLTQEHLLIDGDTLKWKPASEFKPGHKVLSLCKIPGHSDDLYIVDTVPENWMVVVEGPKVNEIVRLVTQLSNNTSGSKDMLGKVHTIQDRVYISVDLLRRLLRRHNELREGLVAFARDDRTEMLTTDKVTPELAYLIGVFLVAHRLELDCNNGDILIEFGDDRQDILDVIMRYVTKVTGKAPNVVKKSVKVSLEGGKSSEVRTLRVNSLIISHLVKYFQEDLARLFKLPDDALKGFIAGLVDSRGRLISGSSNGTDYINIVLKNPDLAKTISVLLRRLNIYSRVEAKRKKVVVRVIGHSSVSKLHEAVRPYSVRVRNIETTTRKTRTSRGDTIPRSLSVAIASKILEVLKAEGTRLPTSILEKLIEASQGDRILTKSWVEKLKAKLSNVLPEEVVKLIDIVTSRDYCIDEVLHVDYIDYEGFVYDLYVPGLHNFLAGGIIVHNCIDEIDKMRDEDRSAIHEALEQQTVSIAKAGIVARLNARTSVLAAGNPKHGRYDPTQPLSRNIDLPPTILSRFDLIFIVQDIPNVDHDRRLAKHILGIHAEAERARGFIDAQLLKKYISYARRYVRPQLTPEAIKLIEDFYVNLRQASLVANEGGPSAIAITPRQLEALIRLAEAHARMALKSKATVEDAEEAIRLVMATLSRVGFDIESGKIDIDILETGVSASRREKKKRFTTFLFKLLDEVGGEIELNELYKRAQEQGFEKDFVLEVIDDLKRGGEIYFPKIGKIARVK